MAQGLLSFHYEAERSGEGLTALAGLGVYLELFQAAGLPEAVRRHVRAAGKQGWHDVQMVGAGLALNLAGGACVDDPERLEKDEGFTRLMREAEKRMLTRRERRALKERLRRGRKRTLSSPTAMLDWLAKFHNADEEAKREAGKAFIPAVSKLLAGLMAPNGALISFLQGHRPETTATLDEDATLVETHKRQALFCSKKFRAYQPLNVWWWEQGVILHSEFRDGNVPAGFDKLERAAGGAGRLAGGGEHGAPAHRYCRLQPGSPALLRRGQGRALRGEANSPSVQMS